MKNIVFISGIQISPPISGGHLRSINLVQALAKQGHQVSVYSFTGRRDDYVNHKESSEAVIDENLTEYVNRSKLFGALQFLSYRFSLPPFWLTLLTKMAVPKRLKKLIANADTVIIDFPFLYPLIKDLKVNTILNTHNVEAELAVNQSLAKWVSKIEHKAVQIAKQSIFCSIEDMQHFEAHENEQFFVIENGISMQGTGLDNRLKYRESLRNELDIAADANVVLFTGSRHTPNLRALEYLEQFHDNNQVMLERLNIVFLVVGSVAAKAYTKSRMIVTSFVDSTLPYFHAADLAINPIWDGSGTNVKMMEYMAHHLPIISTEFGARGFDLAEGEQCIYFDKHNLAEKLEGFLSNHQREDFLTFGEGAFVKNANKVVMEKIVQSSPINW